MTFFLTIELNKIGQPVQVKHNPEEHPFKHALFFTEKLYKVSIINYSKGRAWIIGDIIGKLPDKVTDNIFTIAHEIKGRYFIIAEESENILVIPGIFSFLSVYYNQNGHSINISDDLFQVCDYVSGKLSINKMYLLERSIFNFSILNNTWFNEISLLTNHHYLKISPKEVKEVKYFSPADCFTSSPTSWKSSITDVADCFIEISREYMPEEKYFLSFTSGFDGRTLLACSKYFNKDFISFAFGTKDSTDVKLPQRQSQKLNLKFLPLLLSEEYQLNYYNVAAEGIILKSFGHSTSARAHYYYAATEISKECKYMLSGNFGSELFRTVHSGITLTNDWLLKLFLYDDIEKWQQELTGSNVLYWLSQEYFKTPLNEIKAKLLALTEQYDKNMPLNARFYFFMWDVVLKAYFGAELAMQQNILINRTPFSDLNFYKELQKTELSGAYGSFLEKNPVKRFKGQAAYAEIIKKTYPRLLNLATGKGYKPKDLLKSSWKLNLVKSFILKKIRGPVLADLDPFLSDLCFSQNINHFYTEPNKLLNHKIYSDLFSENSDFDSIEDAKKIVSINYFLSKLAEKYEFNSI